MISRVAARSRRQKRRRRALRPRPPYSRARPSPPQPQREPLEPRARPRGDPPRRVRPTPRALPDRRLHHRPHLRRVRVLARAAREVELGRGRVRRRAGAAPERLEGAERERLVAAAPRSAVVVAPMGRFALAFERRVVSSSSASTRGGSTSKSSQSSAPAPGGVTFSSNAHAPDSRSVGAGGAAKILCGVTSSPSGVERSSPTRGLDDRSSLSDRSPLSDGSSLPRRNCALRASLSSGLLRRGVVPPGLGDSASFRRISSSHAPTLTNSASFRLASRRSSASRRAAARATPRARAAASRASKPRLSFDRAPRASMPGAAAAVHARNAAET